MKKTSYFIVQILWSFVLTFVICILALLHLDFDSNTYYPGAFSEAGSWLLGGMLVYFILTIVYIVIGYRKVREWRWWVVLVSLVLALVMWILGCAVCS